MATRRRFLAALAALPALARGQGAPPRRIAWFGVGAEDDYLPYIAALQDGLRDAGWQEGRNLVLSRHASAGALDAFEPAVRAVLAAKPEIVVTQEFATLAMLRFAQGTVPVVFGFSGDPVEAKLVKSLARPETNFTGITYLASELVGKRIEFLRQALPHTRRIGIIARPQHPGEPEERRASEEAAKRLGVEIHYRAIFDGKDIEPAFADIRKAGCDALVVFPDYTMYRNRQLISQLAAAARLPAVSGWSSFADSGLLFNYGPNLRDIYRRLGSYVDRILHGTRAGDLPVDLPRNLELVVNLRTARALGIDVAPGILVRADRVID
jgi:putative tryptophan/tyrosine transport system substrate-binding protein